LRRIMINHESKVEVEPSVRGTQRIHQAPIFFPSSTYSAFAVKNPSEYGACPKTN
jgi:hypothetical protein